MKEEKPSVEIEEVGLEELIILGEKKKVPIHIIYPHDDGRKTKSKALIRQLTLQEMDNIKTTENLHKKLLRKALFKQDGSHFSMEELNSLPLGVVNAIGNAILELSGVDTDELRDF